MKMFITQIFANLTRKNIKCHTSHRGFLIWSLCIATLIAINGYLSKIDLNIYSATEFCSDILTSVR